MRRALRASLPALAGGLLGGLPATAAAGWLAAAAGWPTGWLAGLAGLAGAVTGALLADRACRHTRPLTAAEKLRLREVFGDALDCEPIRLTCHSALALLAPTTTGNTINLQRWPADGGSLHRTGAGLRLLVHEAGHVWQYQNGGVAYAASSVAAQSRALLTRGSRRFAYDWRAAAAAGRAWEDWNAEQQAECIAAWACARQRLRGAAATPEDRATVASTEPFVALVRAGRGAPGRRRLS